MAEIKEPVEEAVNDSILNCKDCDSSRVTLTAPQKLQELNSVVEEKTDAEINVIPAESIEIVPALTKVAAGDMIKFDIEQTPVISNAPVVTWEVDKTDLAEVDQNGLLTTKAKGSIKLIATTSTDVNEPVTHTLSLEIVDAPLQLTLDHTTGEVTVGGPENTLQLTPTIKPSAACSDIVWSSSNSEVASVEAGLVTAVATDVDTDVIITAKTLVGGLTAECKVTVHPSQPLP